MRYVATLLLLSHLTGVRSSSVPAWRLIAHDGDLTVWINATDIDRSRPDGMIGVTFRVEYRTSEPVPYDSSQSYKEVQLDVAVDCHAERVRDLRLVVILPPGSNPPAYTTSFTTPPVSFAAYPLGRPTLSASCAWLRDPNRFTPIVVGAGTPTH
jgi:hypothetical protein